MDKRILIKKVSPELRNKLKKELTGCMDADAVSEILAKNGIQADMAQCEAVLEQFAEPQELDLEDMEAAAGGCGSSEPKKCPQCGSTDITPDGGEYDFSGSGHYTQYYTCNSCNHNFR